MKTFLNGLTTGLILQLAVGPVFFFIVSLTIQKNFLDGFAGVLGVTLVDYLYITLAIVGIGKLLEHKRVKKIFGIISSIVLIIFGVIMIKNITNGSVETSTTVGSGGLVESFVAVFLLTIFNPMTIVFFTSLFTTKALEFNYTKADLLIFGFGTGFATFLFMGLFVVLFSLVKGIIPFSVITILNLIVGCLLIIYGSVRSYKVLNTK